MSVMFSTLNNCSNFVRCALFDVEVTIHECTGFFNTANMVAFNTEKHGQKILFFAKIFTDIYGEKIKQTFYNGPYSNAIGTYYHPIVFLYASILTSEELYINSVAFIIRYFNTYWGRKLQFSRLLRRCEQSFVTLEHNVQFKLWHIKHSGLDLVMNTNIWINVTNFCKSNFKNKIMDFERHSSFKSISNYMAVRLGRSPIAKLGGYQTIWNGTYYHPILFLKMVALINDEFYIKVFCMVFGESAHRNILEIDKVKTLPFEIFPIFPLETLPVKTKLTEEHLVTLINMTCVPSDANECQNPPTSALTVHQKTSESENIEILKNKLGTTDRSLKNTLSLLSDIGQELNHVKTKYSNIFQKYQELKVSSDRMNDLQESNKTAQTFPKHTINIDTNNVCDLQTLLVVRLKSETIYGFRKPLKNLMSFVIQNIHAIKCFDTWCFIDHYSTSDFSRLQDYMRIKYANGKCDIQASDSELIVKNATSNLEDIPKSIINFFIDFPEFIKLDINVFKNKFEKTHFEINKSILPTINRLYYFVINY